MLQKTFSLMNNWQKLKSLSRGGYGSTYTMRVDKVKKKEEVEMH
jgi:hypothetical protein